jgi:NADH:ubiquinone oxidoreductase subunit 6 (subunit J)
MYQNILITIILIVAIYLILQEDVENTALGLVTFYISASLIYIDMGFKHIGFLQILIGFSQAIVFYLLTIMIIEKKNKKMDLIKDNYKIIGYVVMIITIGILITFVENNKGYIFTIIKNENNLKNFENIFKQYEIIFTMLGLFIMTIIFIMSIKKDREEND